MKKIRLIPTIGLSLLTLNFFASTSVLSSCSNRTESYLQEVLDEFIGNQQKGINGITSCPRPGRYYDAIVPYLKQRAMNIANLPESEVHIDPESHNIYFDIPSTPGFENKDMVIIQGHTDMIVAGLTEEEAKTTSIIPVIDNDTIHSQGFKTSLGADNGIGLSIALAILKNRNNFNHGPLRFLMTADEDIGMIGASKLDPDWLKYKGNYIKWLINVDAEEEGYVCRSCPGSTRTTITQDLDPTEDISSVPNEYTLKIDGLIGGHSGVDIIKNRANADRLAYEFLYSLISLTNNGNTLVQIVSHDHKRIIDGQEKDINYSQNQLIANCKLIFKTNATYDTIRAVWTDCINAWKDKEIYKGDDWHSISENSSLTTNTQPATKALTADVSHRMINMMGNYNLNPTADKMEGFYFGVQEYNDEAKTSPKSSLNLGPISVTNNENKLKVSIAGSARSSVGDKSSNEKYSINWINNQYSQIVQTFKFPEWIPSATYYPWKKDENNQLVRILANGYQSLGVTPTIFDAIAGVESSWWMEKSNGHITCACVGPRIDGAHNTNETLFIKTIDPCIKNVIGAIKTLAA